ncbi:hypothetical protein AB0A73_21600 [Glycomyces sp. NPDC047369]
MDEHVAAPEVTVHALYIRSTNGWIIEAIDTPGYCGATEPTSDAAIAAVRSKAADVLGVAVERVKVLVAEGLRDEDDGTWQRLEGKSVINEIPDYLQR